MLQKNLKFKPAKLARKNNKSIVELPKKFSAFILTRSQRYKKNINKKKRLFFNFISTSFVKTFISQKGQPIGFIQFENNTNLKINHCIQIEHYKKKQIVKILLVSVETQLINLIKSDQGLLEKLRGKLIR